MAEMTLEQARMRGSDGWARNGYRYDTIEAAAEYADVGDRIYALDIPACPTAADLAGDVLEWMRECALDMDTHWEFLAKIDGDGDACGCVLDDDDEARSHLLAACAALLRHHGHPEGPLYESNDWVVATQEMIDGEVK